MLFDALTLVVGAGIDPLAPDVEEQVYGRFTLEDLIKAAALTSLLRGRRAGALACCRGWDASDACSQACAASVVPLRRPYANPCAMQCRPLVRGGGA